MTPEDRLLSHIRRDLRTGCWHWTAAVDKDGYGWFQFDGKKQHAHRVSYLLFVGEIPSGMWVLHGCDMPGCIRPEHLYLGNAKKNAEDRDGRGRNRSGQAAKTHCPQGHPYAGDNLYRRPSDGARMCRTCVNAYERDYQRRKRERSSQ